MAITVMARPFQGPSEAEDPLLELSGDIDGLPTDLSVTFDRYIAETYASASPPRMRS